MNNRYIAVIFIFTFLVSPAFGKLYDSDNEQVSGRGGHLGDIMRLFIGDNGGVNTSPFEWRKFTKSQEEVFHIIARAAQLAFDSTEYNMGAAKIYRDMLMDSDLRKKYGLKAIPELTDFVSSKRRISFSEHELYTHLGWDHDYRGEDQKKWLAGRSMFINTINSLFNFSLSSSSQKKLESFSALIYYVHILGDHEENDVTTAHTRIPLLSKDEQIGKPGWKGWKKEKERQPESTIVKDLEIHLKNLFSDSDNKTVYKNLIEGLKRIDGINVSAKARRLLDLLFHYCPILLPDASFSKEFYNKYGLPKGDTR